MALQVMLTLEFIYVDNDDGHQSFVVLAPPEAKTALDIRKFLASSLAIPLQSIYLFNEKPPLKPFISEVFTSRMVDPIKDSIDIPKIPTRWYWTHLAEEPDNFSLKNYRLMSLLKNAIQQLTVDMNMALFGLFKEARALSVESHDWVKIGELDLEGAWVDWKIQKWEEMEKAYENYYVEHGCHFLIKLYDHFVEKLTLIKSDLENLKKNLKGLNDNDSTLNLNLKLYAPHSEEKYESVEKGLSAYSPSVPITTTIRTLEYSIQSNYYDIQKVSGMFIQLKKEECQIETLISRLVTHRKLFVLRGYLLLLEKKKIHPPIVSTYTAELAEYMPSIFDITRRVIEVENNLCIPVCCIKPEKRNNVFKI